MKRFVAVVVTACLVPLALSVGCANGEVSDSRLDKIVREVVQANAAIETTAFDLTLDSIMEVQGDSDVSEVKVTGVGSGVVDSANETMHMTMTMVTAVPGQDAIELPVEYYIVDGWMYMSMEVPGQSVQWMKMQMPDGMWEEQSQIQQQIDLIRDAEELTHLGMQEVNGVQCHVVKIVPDMASVQQMVSQAQGQMSGLEGLDLSTMDPGQMIQSMSMTQYIAEESLLFMKTVQHMQLVITSDQMGMPEGEFERITEEISTTMVFRDFNEAATIQLPQGALAATRIGL